MLKQQKQTKNFFEKKARDWSKSSKHTSAGLINTIYQRNQYVIDNIQKYKLKNHLDVACGSGDLSFITSKITDLSIGIDFSKKMIKIAKKKYKNKKLEFICKSIFEYKTDKLFDCISANGFIEYLSIPQIKDFFKLSNEKLDKKGILIFGSRNRLFNIFSLNKFSRLENNLKTFNNFYEEAINLTNLKLIEFLRLKQKKFEKVKFRQPKTGGVKVDVRHQFSPLQLANILEKTNFKIIDIYPINYHPVPTSIFHEDKNYKFFSKYIYTSSKNNKLPMIPFSSTFMIAAKKVRKK